MKICFLAPANNYHTRKWCSWFCERGHEVHVVSFIDDKIDNVIVHFIDTGAQADSTDSKKLKYLFKVKDVKKIVKQIKPDIVNAHYATSYGTVAALAGLKNYILSVWGMDIYDFPKKSMFHKMMLKYSLSHASHIFSTSYAMAIETKKYTKKHVDITPFGVDMKLFNPDKRKRKINDDKYIIGTIKALTPKYGIEYLIKAVAFIKNNRPDIPIELRIAGKGEMEKEYKELAIREGIEANTHWLGFISQERCAAEWANMDVGIVPSVLDSESFGVSAVEAEACGVPVIISDIPGLMEATFPKKSSIVVERCNVNELASKIIYFYDNREMRLLFGKEGRKFVEERYELNNCFRKIEHLFEEYLDD